MTHMTLWWCLYHCCICKGGGVWLASTACHNGSSMCQTTLCMQDRGCRSIHSTPLGTGSHS